MSQDRLDLAHCFPISEAAARAYEEKRDALLETVNAQMAARADIQTLIGGNTLKMMTENHANHHHLLCNVFKLNQYALLRDTIPWVYRAYRAHGFEYDYFPIELSAWIDALEAHLDVELARPLVAVYRWMKDAHAASVVASQAQEQAQPADDDAWLAPRRAFLGALLAGDHRACLALATEHVRASRDMGRFFVWVIQPALYDVGRLWEYAEITIAQEHLASTIVGRVMTAVYLSVQGESKPKGRAITAAAPEELHQLGAWMLADLLELHGWEVRYLGANTPREDLVAMVRSFRPALVCLSVTMSFNLAAVGETIALLRASAPSALRIMVGGRALNAQPTLWQTLGADGHAPDALAAIQLAEEWWEQDLKWNAM